jgi:hypothetical protein
LTNFPQSVTRRAMGRPPIKRDMKVEKTTLWLHRPVVDRIIELVGKQGLSDFAREALQRELNRREKAQGQSEKGSGRSSTP